MNIKGKGTVDHTYDAIVVGSGISGGWAAKELSEKGLKTLVLEIGRDVAHGDYLYFEYFNNRNTPEYEDFEPERHGRFRGQMQALRWGPYMGVRYDVQSENDDFEIYNVADDPKQTQNLANAGASEVLRLQEKFKDLVLQSRRPDAEAQRPYDGALMPYERGLTGLPPGLLRESFSGQFSWVPNPVSLSAMEISVAPKIEPVKEVGALVHRGYLEAPRGGSYTFSAAADGGVVVRLHDSTIVNADFGYDGKSLETVDVLLEAGLHPITVYSRHVEQGEPRLELRWSGPEFDSRTINASALKHRKL